MGESRVVIPIFGILDVTGEVIGDHLPDQRAAVAFALRQQLVRCQP